MIWVNISHRIYEPFWNQDFEMKPHILNQYKLNIQLLYSASCFVWWLTYSSFWLKKHTNILYYYTIVW